jgi:hypothetical protein
MARPSFLACSVAAKAVGDLKMAAWGRGAALFLTLSAAYGSTSLTDLVSTGEGTDRRAATAGAKDLHWMLSAVPDGASCKAG